jgi:hypothetical protein
MIVVDLTVTNLETASFNVEIIIEITPCIDEKVEYGKAQTTALDDEMRQQKKCTRTGNTGK